MKEALYLCLNFPFTHNSKVIAQNQFWLPSQNMWPLTITILEKTFYLVVLAAIQELDLSCLAVSWGETCSNANSLNENVTW